MVGHNASLGFNSASYDINVVKKYLHKKYGNISKIEKQWIQTLETELGSKLEENKKIDRYNVDGYDKLTNTAYELNGCYFHGCRHCYEADELNLLTGDTMGQ